MSGRIRADPTGSILDLCYGAPLWVTVFYIVWYSFLIIAVAAVVTKGWSSNLADSDKAMVAAIYLGLLVAPLGLHAIGTRNSEDELAALTAFLTEHAETKL